MHPDLLSDAKPVTWASVVPFLQLTDADTVALPDRPPRFTTTHRMPSRVGAPDRPTARPSGRRHLGRLDRTRVEGGADRDDERHVQPEPVRRDVVVGGPDVGHRHTVLPGDVTERLT